MIYQKKLKIVQDYCIRIPLASSTGMPAEIYCKVHDTIDCRAPIAKVFRSKYMTVFPIKKAFDIAQSSTVPLKKYIKVTDTQKVLAGTVIAQKLSRFSLNTIKAPFDGIVSLHGDNLEIYSTPVEELVYPPVPGSITSISKEYIVIQTKVYKVFPVFTKGKAVYGKFVSVQDIYGLKGDLKDTIVFLNGTAGEDFVKKSISIGVKGVIALSLSSSVLALATEDITVVSLEGFGNIECTLYEKLLESKGVMAFIDTGQKSVVVGTESGIGDLRDVYIKQLTEGDYIQVFDREHFGMVAKVMISKDDRNIEIRAHDGYTFTTDRQKIIGILQ